MSCFCKILDSPDILETVVQVWTEDVYSTLNLTQKKSVQLAMNKMEEVCNRIYPVLFSDGFAFQSSQPTASACGNPVLMAKRKELTIAALRFNNPQAK